MKKIVVVSLILLTMTSFAQTKLYVHKEIDNYVENTKTIAILPLTVKLKLKSWKLAKYSTEKLKEMSQSESIGIQSTMYSWFLIREKRGELFVNIQDPSRTNTLLKENGIDIHSCVDYSPRKLGEILGVETLITGDYETTKPMANKMSKLSILSGNIFTRNKAILKMNFTSTADNQLVVSYYQKIKGNIGSDSQDLINVLMRKASSKIPYTK